MCGIFGINQSKDHKFIKKFIELQNHRGPDSKNFYLNNKVTLIHNRLSILDLQYGDQPMIYNGKVIVYNGEIFNSPTIRKNLEKIGYSFKTKNSDTEVLLKLYDYKGAEMLNELNGMFAFVIYDIKKNILFGAVDQFSNKPLYYSLAGDNFAFSSEIKPLLKLKQIDNELCFNSINKYFQLQYIPFGDTIYKNINKLNNSNYFEYNLNSKKIDIQKYSKKIHKVEFNSYKDIIIAGRNALEQSVKNWSLSDVPIIFSLSGGLDSSLISSIYSNISKKRIETVTVGFDDVNKDQDERSFAKIISKNINSLHHEIVINSNNFLKDMDVIFENLCEPYAGSLASWYVYKNLSNKKVIFTGTGADELFGNYGKWKNYLLSDFFIKNIHKNLFSQNLKNIKYFYGYMYKKIFYENELNKLILKNQNYSNDLNLIIHSLVQNKKFDPKKNIQEIDFNLQLPWEFLYITDRLSMLNSIEARTPFLDDEMINYIKNVPSEYLSKMTNSKILLKDIARKYIPDEIINRKKKGFVLPKETWLKKELKNQLIYFASKEFLSKQEIFSYSYLDNLLKKFFSSNKNINLTEKTWTFFIFQFWYEKNVFNR
tara:strand:+ start:1112 stop:2902 length:1791 start_codon:yes stop_codon:yes gene_type:complete